MDYTLVKALHLVAVISFMAGILYLPRLYSYHVTVPAGGDQARLFEVMERKLLRIIINPALIIMWLLGLYMLHLNPEVMQQPWMKAKVAFAVAITIFHALCARWRRQLAAVPAGGAYPHSNRFFRAVNEVPTVLMIVIVVLAVTKPLL
jgi:putative membrane protein